MLSQLNPDQAAALRLRFFSGLKFHEIAVAMHCSLATAKNRVRWGLERLAAALAEAGLTDPSVAGAGAPAGLEDDA